MLEFLGIAFFSFLSEDLACITAGGLAARMQLNLWSAILSSYVGIVAGDLLLYYTGYAGGGFLLNARWVSRYLKPEKISRAKMWLETSGAKMIVLSRFVPGTRLPTYVAAGVLRMPVARFTLLLLLAASVWTPLLVVASYLSGAWLLEYFTRATFFTRFAAMAGIVGALWLAARLVLSLATWRGRRLLYSRIQRILRWEFWPMAILYIPVGVYLVYLALRHRQLTAFTACNPAIYASGIRGESKSEILSGLMLSARRFGAVAPFICIAGDLPTNEKITLAQKFIRQHARNFPVVVKPDVGERGNGVLIAKSREELELHLRETRHAVILQQYVPGREYGVFYYRYPGETSGKIFAITDKRLLMLAGDGVRSLEQLILSDARAVLMARFHLQNHRTQLDYVVPKGKFYPLVSLGTHCKGGLFLDGNHLITPTLTRAVDKISQNFRGFYFGRYDIRVPSEDDLKRGAHFKILELNGVTSEATNIYDPRHSLLFAYRTLFRQWHIAVEIGLANIRQGAKPVGLKALLKLAFSK